MPNFFDKYPYTDFHELNLDWVLETVKRIAAEWAETLTEWHDTQEEWQQLYDYVHDYFDNLDVQQEINNKLDQMALDGTLATIAQPIIDAKVAELLPGEVASQIGSTVSDQIPSVVSSQLPSVVSDTLPAVASPIISDWLSDHITQPTTPAIDTSLSVQGAAADAAAVGDAVNDILDDIQTSTGYRRINFTEDYYIYFDTVANLTPQYNATYQYAVISCSPGDKFTIKAGSGPIGAYAFADSSLNVLQSSSAYVALDDLQVTAPADTAYLIVNDNGKTGYAYYGYGLLKDNFSSFVSDINELQIYPGNLFDKNAADNIDNYYLDISSGAVLPLTGYFTSGYLDVSRYSDINLSYVQLSCFYDESMGFISGNANSGYAAYDEKASIPAGAKYIRISSPDSYKSIIQVGIYASRHHAYAEYGNSYIFNRLSDIRREIVVAPSGGDYTSLTEAVYDNVYNGITIRVKPGTYDIVSEYNTKFTSAVVDTLSDADDLGYNFQYGIFINNRTIIFEPGSHVTCDWTGHTVDGSHRFSVFAVGNNAVIKGLDLDCTATFYAIHDDYGYADAYYENIYQNCRILGHSIVNQNIIGGGCKPFSKHVIDNCYFDNGDVSSSVCVRYHNCDIANAEPVIWINNTYFEQDLTLCWYGNQLTKMTVYVNNCRARNIGKVAEGGSVNDNVDLITWLNETV